MLSGQRCSVIAPSRSQVGGCEVRTMEGNDLISALPDAILIQVFSHLHVRDQIRTCVLSKKWRNLWTVSPYLDFRKEMMGSDSSYFEEDRESEIDVVEFINCSLLAHEGVKVARFCISIPYEYSHTCQVTSWIRFALRHKVEELYLDFLAESPCFEEFDSEFIQLYQLPHCIFSSDSLVCLTLKFCQIKFQTPVYLRSLTTLNLNQMLITSDVLQIFLSGCPLLENLDISDCNRSCGITIKTDQRLKKLRVEDVSYVNGSNAPIKINAPMLICLDLKGNCPREDYKVKRLSSLEKVSIDFEAFGGYQHEYGSDYCDTDGLKRLLESLSHVKHIHLCNWCVQVMTIRELKCLDAPVLATKCLEVNTGMTPFELPGLVHLLKSCCELDTLILRIGNKLAFDINNWLDDEEDYVNEKQYLKWLELCFSRLLHRLKTVRIYGLLGTVEIYDPELFKEGGMKRFICEFHQEINFVKLVLKNTRTLEKMTISTTTLFDFWSNKSEMVKALRKQIMSFPRASRFAKVVLLET